jgi:GMP synthase-like glutamine amidotransferase
MVMKIGILNAFPPEERIVNWNGTVIDAYIRFLELVPNPFTYAGYNVAQGQFPDSSNECDAYLITGSPRGVYDSDVWIIRLARFIRDCYQEGKKLVGICFGHQILAHALGGFSEKSAKGWGLGLKAFEIIERKPWLTGKPQSCSLYFVHQDQVVRLPPGAELLGTNAFCPNLFFVIKDQVLGIQGHPEFTAEIMDDIFSALEGTVEEHVYENALNSVQEGAPDNQLVAGWIVNFFTS